MERKQPGDLYGEIRLDWSKVANLFIYLGSVDAHLSKQLWQVCLAEPGSARLLVSCQPVDQLTEEKRLLVSCVWGSSKAEPQPEERERNLQFC